jgi:hypothetical protein
MRILKTGKALGNHLAGEDQQQANALILSAGICVHLRNSG